MGEAAREYTEYLDTKAMAESYPHLFSRVRLWEYAKARARNGLEEQEAVTVSATGRLYWHAERTVRWYLNLGK